MADADKRGCSRREGGAPPALVLNTQCVCVCVQRKVFTFERARSLRDKGRSGAPDPAPPVSMKNSCVSVFSATIPLMCVKVDAVVSDK
jgi:hypothetical protein